MTIRRWPVATESTTARGYGHPYQRRRAREVSRLRAAGSVPCCRPCSFDGMLYAEDLARDYRRDPRYPHLDHCDYCRGHGCAACGGAGYNGLAHARCNTRAGARRGNQIARAAAKTYDRW